MAQENTYLLVFIILKVEVGAGVTIPTEAFLAKLKGHLRKVVIPPKLAIRHKRGPILFKCCRVVFNKETNKLELPEGEVVGTTVRDFNEEEEYKNTTVGLKEDEESDVAGMSTRGNSRKGFLFQTSVLWKGRDFASWDITKGRKFC